MAALGGPSQETKSMYGNRLGFGSNIKRRQLPYDKYSTIEREGVVKETYFLPGRLPSVDVELTRGGILKFLPFPGGNIDDVTGFLHGDFIMPVVGQRVMVSFSEGDTNNPYISALIWRAGNGIAQNRYQKEFPTLNNENDILRSHRSGSFHLLGDLEIISAFDVKIDPTGIGDIVQDLTGVYISSGGVTQLLDEVAVSNINYVLTAAGPQPILEASYIGPRAPLGTFLFA